MQQKRFPAIFLDQYLILYCARVYLKYDIIDLFYYKFSSF